MRRLMMWVVAAGVSAAIAGCLCCPKKGEPPAKKEGAKVTTPVPPAKK